MNWRKKLKDFGSFFLVALLFFGIFISVVGVIYCYKVLVIDVYNWNILTLMPVVITIVLVLIGLNIV